MLDVWFLVGSEFSKREAWGDPAKMSGVLLVVLRALRQTIGKPFVIHCGWAVAGHAPDSKHYTGDAVDFHIADLPYPAAIKAINDALIALQITDRVGLGIYPEWKQPGFHLDIRPVRARWGRVGGRYVSSREAINRALELAKSNANAISS